MTERVEKALMTTGKIQGSSARIRGRAGLPGDLHGPRRVPKRRARCLVQIRKKVGDIRPTLPPAPWVPFFNDGFGDTFGSICALTGRASTTRC